MLCTLSPSSFNICASEALQNATESLRSLLFFEIYGFPFLIMWLIAGSVFFTFRLGFVNITLFRHSFSVVLGKYTHKDEPGELSHFQALAAAVSGTVGMGTIAGVAVAIAMGGPGAIFWMVIAGLFGMSAKFAEVTLGHKYRVFDEKGNVSGGAFYYLEQGLKEKNWPRLGKCLATFFAICCIGGTIGGGNMVQSNQTVLALRDAFVPLRDYGSYLAFGLALLNAIVLIGGIKRIAIVAEKVVPLMAFIFISGALCVLFINRAFISEAFLLIIEDAFTGKSLGGGAIGAMIAGFRRAAISSEAGLGSSPIAHATARTNEPVREGCVALLETFIATSVICIISGLTIVVSGVYKDSSIEPGVLLSSAAFATVADWFPGVLSIAIALFAYTTMITWSYYGEKSWIYLFGRKYVRIYQIAFCVLTYIGGIAHFGILIDFSDMLTYTMALPNLIGLYIMQNIICQELRSYKQRLKNGEFVKVKK